MGKNLADARAAKTMPASLADHLTLILTTADPAAKVELAKQTAKLWFNRGLSLGLQSQSHQLPKRPVRPALPELRPPRDMPRRRISGAKGRIAHIHAIAHIEFSAIDMAFDLAARFLFKDVPKSFFSDFIQVGVEEAKHFSLLDRRLRQLGSCYGALPAHDGLWQTVEKTGEDVLARLAIVPLVLEARGLDVSPSMIEKFAASGDTDTARILRIIFEDEKRHVAIGMRWFLHCCRQAGKAPQPTFHDIVRTYFRGGLKPPFNDKARSQAGLVPGFYKPLTAA